MNQSDTFLNRAEDAYQEVAQSHPGVCTEAHRILIYAAVYPEFRTTGDRSADYLFLHTRFNEVAEDLENGILPQGLMTSLDHAGVAVLATRGVLDIASDQNVHPDSVIEQLPHIRSAIQSSSAREAMDVATFQALGRCQPWTDASKDDDDAEPAL